MHHFIFIFRFYNVCSHARLTSKIENNSQTSDQTYAKKDKKWVIKIKQKQTLKLSKARDRCKRIIFDKSRIKPVSD